MPPTLKGLALLAAAAPLLAACQSTAREAPAAPDTSMQTSQGQAAPQVDPAVEQRARKALSDAGIAGPLELVSAEAVQWNDSSLGCRQPGQQYLQVITDGHVLQFSSGKGPAHQVHVAGETAVVCSPALGTGVVQRPSSASRARNLDVIVTQARADLASRLGVKLENVALRDINPATWNDDRLGCEADANPARTPPVRGHTLLFSTTAGNYLYHTDGERFAPCPAIAPQ